ncbi:MAG TPA: VOC family protein [Candidatus Binataceae bacterium]|nr:VOC family protein [Candidatus Binataceae bacterium]
MNSTHDIGLTHVALVTTDPDRSVAFYEKFAGMRVVHRRVDAETHRTVVWLSDQTRPFVIVLIETDELSTSLRPFAHLGVGCRNREEVDHLCREAVNEDCLLSGPTDSGYPVGYWAFLTDPDGNTLELSYGQEIALTVSESR